MDNQSDFSQNQIWRLLAKKLANEASEEETRELDSLLEKNHDLQLRAEMLTQMWAQQNIKKDTTESEAAYMRHLLNFREDFFPEHHAKEPEDLPAEPATAPAAFKKIFSGKRILAGAVVICVVITSWFLFKPKKYADDKDTLNAISSIITKNGNRTKITLPDGSQVWLNAGSRLDYNNNLYNQQLREVHLSGEAYFDVVKNPQRPFLVHTDNLQIKVLGTAFDVKSYPGDKESEASLIRGSVEVTVAGREEKFILRPNDKIVVSIKNGTIDKEKIKKEKAELKESETTISFSKVNYMPEKNVSIETAWVENRLEFHSAKFSEVAKKMERWFDVTITFTDKKMEDILFTGPLPSGSVEQALEALKIAESFNYTIEGKIITIKP